MKSGDDTLSVRNYTMSGRSLNGKFKSHYDKSSILKDIRRK